MVLEGRCYPERRRMFVPPESKDSGFDTLFGRAQAEFGAFAPGAHNRRPVSTSSLMLTCLACLRGSETSQREVILELNRGTREVEGPTWPSSALKPDAGICRSFQFAAEILQNTVPSRSYHFPRSSVQFQDDPPLVSAGRPREIGRSALRTKADFGRERA
jgi:hypothetical protein